MPKCYILIGIPCSGKSTWTKKRGIPIISCDQIRGELNKGKKYIFDPNQEKIVWNTFYERLIEFRGDFIIDNTNCKLIYINKIKQYLHKDYEIEYIWFDIPLWKAYYRNIKRRIFNNKWIPVKVLKNMKSNYNKLKKEWKN